MPQSRETTDEIARLRAELEDARAALANAELVATALEQHRVAQVLHDTVCQTMSGVLLMARVASRRLQQNYPEGAADVIEMGELISQAVRELQSLMGDLRAAADRPPGPPPKRRPRL